MCVCVCVCMHHPTYCGCMRDSGHALGSIMHVVGFATCSACRRAFTAACVYLVCMCLCSQEHTPCVCHMYAMQFDNSSTLVLRDSIYRSYVCPPSYKPRWETGEALHVCMSIVPGHALITLHAWRMLDHPMIPCHLVT